MILFHMGYAWMPGGFVGVDVFFVISGFLITSIILKDHAAGEFTFSNFWARRIRRILPAMIVTLAVTLLVGFFVLFGSEVNTLAFHTLAALFSVANISMWLTAGSYWGSAAEESPLLHTWSLSVEEQFYLLFPAFLILLLAKWRRAVIPALILLNVGSFALYIVGSMYRPNPTFFLLPTRIWELGAGCLLAVLMFRGVINPAAHASRFFSLLGVALILASSFLFSGIQPIPGQLLLPVLGTVLIIACCVRANDWMYRFLTLGAVVFVGKISYSLYLWHWPVIVLGREYLHRSEQPLSELVFLPIMFVLAVLSYFLVENPTRRRAGMVPWILVAFAALAIVSTLVYRYQPRYDISRFNPIVWKGLLYGSGDTTGVDAAQRRNMPQLTLVEPTEEDLRSLREDLLLRRAFGAARATVVLYGDSHAIMYASTLESLAEELELEIVFLTTPGRFLPELPLRPGDPFFDLHQRRLDLIESLQPDVLLVSYRWSNYINPRGIPWERDLEKVNWLVNFASRNAGKVFLIQEPPELPIGNVMAAEFFAHRGYQPAEPEAGRYHPVGRPTIHTAAWAMMLSVAEQHDNVTGLGTQQALIREVDGRVRVILGADVLYTDDDHLSEAGARQLSPLFRSTLVGILGEP